jgi:hypothetical protein
MALQSHHRAGGEATGRIRKAGLERYARVVESFVYGGVPVASAICFAFYLQLAYSRRTYGEHFLFALHVHSFWFLVLLVLLLPLPEWIRMLVQAYLIVYSVAALHAVYVSAWWTTVLKGLLIGLAYAASLLMATILIGIWAVIE